MATRVAAWVLVIYAVVYTALLVFMLILLVPGTPEISVFLFLLLPAVSAGYAAMRIVPVLGGGNLRFHLWPGLALLAGAAYFGAIFLAEVRVALRAVQLEAFGTPVAVVILMFGLPAALSLWIGGLYGWSGIRAFWHPAS